jgi:hypothetical protein
MTSDKNNCAIGFAVSDGDARQPYQAPRLVEFGNVGTSDPSWDDGSTRGLDPKRSVCFSQRDWQHVLKFPFRSSLPRKLGRY